MTKGNGDKNKPSPKPNKDADEDMGVLIPEELEPYIALLPPEKRQRFAELILVTIESSVQSFRGPLPPPEMLAAYNEVVKDGSERILRMAEKQSDHRMKIEDRVIRGQGLQSLLGQIFGFVIGLTGICASIYLAMNDHDAVAGLIGGTSLVGLVSVFVIGKRRQAKDLKGKQ